MYNYKTTWKKITVKTSDCCCCCFFFRWSLYEIVVQRRVEIENEIEYLYKVNDVRFTMVDKVIKTVITVPWIFHLTLDRLLDVLLLQHFIERPKNITTRTYFIVLVLRFKWLKCYFILFAMRAATTTTEKLVVISHSHCLWPILITCVNLISAIWERHRHIYRLYAQIKVMQSLWTARSSSMFIADKVNLFKWICH